MGYLDDLKDKNRALHKELLGFDHPKEEIEAQKERLKAELTTSSSFGNGVRKLYSKWVGIAAAASVVLFFGIKLMSSDTKSSDQFTDEEMILIESLFVDEDQVDHFLDESLSNVFTE